MANKLNNQSYFVKRLRDSGYCVYRLELNYSETDPRMWTVVIDPGCASVFCTCYRNANPENMKSSSFGDEYFELYDGGQFIPNKVKLSTSSIEVIMTFLHDHGIINKVQAYPESRPRPNTTQTT